MSVRSGPERSSYSAWSRSKASCVSQVVLSVTGERLTADAGDASRDLDDHGLVARRERLADHAGGRLAGERQLGGADDVAVQIAGLHGAHGGGSGALVDVDRRLRLVVVDDREA